MPVTGQRCRRAAAWSASRLVAVVGRLSPLWNGAVWQSRDSFGVNTIGEPCDRKGHARFDGEALVWDGLYGCAVYAPAGNGRTSLARLRAGHPDQCFTLH